MRRDAAEREQAPRDGAPAEPARSVLRPALLRFAALSLLAATVLMLATLVVAERIARDRALEDARRQGAGIATRLASPLVDAEVRAGLPQALEPLTKVMENRMRDGSVQHVKLWSRDGTIIWADQTEIMGRRFGLEDDVEALFGTTRTTAELSDLLREENVAERGEGPMLEVYAGAFDADGEPLVFEAYLVTESMEKNAHRIVVSFVPLIAGALVLFLVVVMPLAVSLSRRVERGERDRARLMRHAVLASDLERRRIARDLHDGVVQELAGLGYTLPTVTRELHADGDLRTARSTLEGATELVQHNVQALRQLLTDIYPPDLAGPGLRNAVHQLVHTEAFGAGLEAQVRIQQDLELPLDAARLAHRVIREGLRNVVKHARASQVLVELGLHEGQVLVRVVDDGEGAGPGPLPLRGPRGHLGLRLLDDTVRDVGGSLEVSSPGTGEGVSLVARFPASLTEG